MFCWHERRSSYNNEMVFECERRNCFVVCNNLRRIQWFVKSRIKEICSHEQPIHKLNYSLKCACITFLHERYVQQSNHVAVSEVNTLCMCAVQVNKKKDWTFFSKSASCCQLQDANRNIKMFLVFCRHPINHSTKQQ